jgi:hypothetical protein
MMSFRAILYGYCAIKNTTSEEMVFIRKPCSYSFLKGLNPNGPRRARTADFYLVEVALSQLSYGTGIKNILSRLPDKLYYSPCTY